MKRRRLCGFSLLELLIVVAIIGVLAGVAYPGYLDSVRKGRRAQARAAIAEVLQQQERFMTQRNCYMGFQTAGNGVVSAVEDAACGIAAGTPVMFKPFSGDSLASAAYLLSAHACTAADVTLSLRECVRVDAQPVLPDTVAGTLWMTSTGAAGCTGTSGTAGFSGAVTCWP